MIERTLEAIDKIPGDEWKIRTEIDDSGDYKTYDFSIYSTNVYSSGNTRDIPMRLGNAEGNLNAAIAFCGAKELAREVRRLRGILDHHRIPYKPDAPNQEEEP